MPIVQDDIAVTEEQTTEWNGVGDAELVTDIEAMRQSIAISALQAYQNTSATIAAQPLEDLRGDIEIAVANNPHTIQPIDVEIGEIDYAESTVTFDISTRRITLSESVTLE